MLNNHSLAQLLKKLKKTPNHPALQQLQFMQTGLMDFVTTMQGSVNSCTSKRAARDAAQKSSGVLEIALWYFVQKKKKKTKQKKPQIWVIVLMCCKCDALFGFLLDFKMYLRNVSLSSGKGARLSQWQVLLSRFFSQNHNTVQYK